MERLLDGQAMEPARARQMNPLQLAYVGDTVWDLMVRQRLVKTGASVKNLHRAATALVNAGAQAQALNRIQEKLSQEEMDLVKRGRNAHARHDAPRNQDPADYSSATGLEALIGYLYLTGESERLEELWRISQQIPGPAAE